MKKFDIRKTFETFLREPLSILTEGLFQIVNIEANIFNKQSSFSVDFMKNKTQLTVVNNEKMCNLLQTVLYKQKIKEVSESMKVMGYDPVTQIVGYLISNDLGYIPDFDDSRNKIATLDRTLILENMISEYLK